MSISILIRHAIARVAVTIALVLGCSITVFGQSEALATIPGCLGGDIVGVASTTSGNGYWLAGSDGGVFSYGDAPFYGSAATLKLNKPVVGIVATASGKGYWLVAADGGIFAFGDAPAPSNNTLPSTTLNQPVVGAARAANGNGLWLTAGDGGVFAFNGAGFYGSAANLRLNKPVVGMASSASGNGYWLVAADGGIFAYGDAPAPANNPLPSQTLNQPIVGAARAGATNGLWLTAGDGGIFAFNGAGFYGSAANLTLNKPVSSIASSPNGAGYWLAARDGGVFAYGNAGFFGNAVSTNPNCTAPAPTTGSVIVQYATDIKNGKAEPGWGGGSVPYSWGGGHGTNPGPSYGTCAGYTGSIQPCPATSTIGVDCSGFTRWVYKLAYGVDVLGGGNTNNQIARMRRVTSPQPGDLVFYGTSSSNTHHVGVYIGSGKMINALKTGTYVRTDNVSVMSDLVGYYRY